jgi:transketolase
MSSQLAEVATREAFADALVELAATDRRVVVLDADLGNATLVDRFAAAAPDRFLQMGVAEQNMIGVAAGLAASGYVPFAATFAAFATHRALDQIRVVVAQPRLPVVVIGSYAGALAGRTGKTHVCVEDLAVFRSLPGMTVLAPGDAGETRRAVAAAASWDGPVYMRLTRDPSPAIGGDERELEIGRGVLLRRGGTDVGIVSTGVQTARSLAAAEQLGSRGLGVSLLHLPTVKPLDEAAVLELARTTRLLVSTEDHSIIGGLGGAVAELLAERHPVRLARIGTRDVYVESAPNDDLLEQHGLSSARVADTVERLVRGRLQDV